MPQYLMSVWHDDDYVVDFTRRGGATAAAQVGAFNEELMSAGAWVFGGGLHARRRPPWCAPRPATCR